MPPTTTTHHRRNLSTPTTPTPSTTIHEISTNFTNLYLNHKASSATTLKTTTLTKSQSQKTRPNPDYTNNQETIKKTKTILTTKPLKNNIMLHDHVLMRNMLQKGWVDRGVRRSFGSVEVEVGGFMKLNGVKVVNADMAPFMQVHAVDVTRKTYDSLEKFTAKTLALTLKKEFDGVYGPAWHCIVGLNFGSFVTHSVGGFLYFSMDQKLFFLLFKTSVQRAH